MSLLEVKNLNINYETNKGMRQAVDGISFKLEESQSLGLVGESGCGKSTAVKGIIGVMPKNALISRGEIRYKNQNILDLSQKEMNDLRWSEISFVPQAAMDSLNPVYTVKNQFLEVLKLKGKLDKNQAVKRAKSLFKKVGLSEDLLDYYPHQFSGGMKQRAIIALALALKPGLIITDEPVTALDVIVQHQILRELKELRKDFNISLIMITHDISVIAQTCEYIAVMYAGRIVEKGPANKILKEPLHPYTMGLENSFPNINKPDKELISIPGVPPDLINPPSGCKFAARCPFAKDICYEKEPGLNQLDTDHYSACIYQDDLNKLREKSSEVETWREGM